jgi:hypothetical protein
MTETAGPCPKCGSAETKRYTVKRPRPGDRGGHRCTPECESTERLCLACRLVTPMKEEAIMDDEIPTPARLAKTYTYVAAMDNHDPARHMQSGTVEEWEWPDDESLSYRIPDGVSVFVKADSNIIFLLDDGRTVRALYVAGWSGAEDRLFLRPMPVGINDDGTPRLRADNGRPVDYSTWMLGPRRTYHLKITEA